MIKKILTHPNPVLKKKSVLVEDYSGSQLRQLIKDLRTTLKTVSNGLGLAAPQIGVNLRVFAIKDENGTVLVFINPRFSSAFKKAKKQKMIEGCLSLPDVSVEIMRAKKVSMKYVDEDGETQIVIGKGVLAQAFQHEIDHLDGILCIDRVKK
jgi:peptide deformylase